MLRFPRVLQSVLFSLIVVGSTGCTSSVIQTPTLATNFEYKELFDENQNPEQFGLRSEFYQHPLPMDLRTISDKAYGITSDHKRARNYIQNELLRRSEQVCTAYQARLTHGFIVGGAASKSVEGLLGVLKTVAAPAEIASNAISDFSTGVTTVSSDILQWEQFKKTHQRIIKVRSAFRSKLVEAQSQSAADYSLSAALYDAERYHSLCNYAAALIGDESFEKIAEESLFRVPPETTSQQALAALKEKLAKLAK